MVGAVIYVLMRLILYQCNVFFKKSYNSLKMTKDVDFDGS